MKNMKILKKAQFNFQIAKNSFEIFLPLKEVYIQNLSGIGELMFSKNNPIC